VAVSVQQAVAALPLLGAQPLRTVRPPADAPPNQAAEHRAVHQPDPAINKSREFLLFFYQQVNYKNI
jgi:hypothetical protein